MTLQRAVALLMCVGGLTVSAVGVAGRAWAGPAEPPAMHGQAGEQTHPTGIIQSAPGGGEMILLGPEFQYVIRGWVGPKGEARGTCAHDHATDAAVGPLQP